MLPKNSKPKWARHVDEWGPVQGCRGAIEVHLAFQKLQIRQEIGYEKQRLQIRRSDFFRLRGPQKIRRKTYIFEWNGQIVEGEHSNKQAHPNSDRKTDILHPWPYWILEKCQRLIWRVFKKCHLWHFQKVRESSEFSCEANSFSKKRANPQPRPKHLKDTALPINQFESRSSYQCDPKVNCPILRKFIGNQRWWPQYSNLKWYDEYDWIIEFGGREISSRAVASGFTPTRGGTTAAHDLPLRGQKSEKVERGLRGVRLHLLGKPKSQFGDKSYCLHSRKNLDHSCLASGSAWPTHPNHWKR